MEGRGSVSWGAGGGGHDVDKDDGFDGDVDSFCFLAFNWEQKSSSSIEFRLDVVEVESAIGFNFGWRGRGDVSTCLLWLHSLIWVFWWSEDDVVGEHTCFCWIGVEQALTFCKGLFVLFELLNWLLLLFELMAEYYLLLWNLYSKENK